MTNTLCGKKIIGSIYFTPGMAYYRALNINNSAINGDLVLIYAKTDSRCGMTFDNVLIIKKIILSRRD